MRVSRALHRLPDGLAASGRELARRAGVTHPTALKALALLVNVGVATPNRGLADDVYDLNRDHVLDLPGTHGPGVETLNRLAHACNLRLAMGMQDMAVPAKEGAAAELKYLAEI